ncbi:MAG TPA: GrpB family protein, partial [Pseudonocardiaceae bacterium]|nr:GrpB family protein [Pseudonocardiaceae bacterium]
MPPATIVDHDPTWPTQARQLLNDAHSALEPLIGSDQFRYEHIGSTAVPGLAAKPILDLQIRMPTLPSLAQLTDLLAPTPFIPER